MADNTEHLKVRLSAEGIAEVTRAFDQVAREAGRTGSKVESALGRMSNAAARLGRLLPALSFGAAVVGAGLLARRSLETADALSKLSVKSGIAVETLSVLQHAASLSDVSLQELTTAFARMNRAAFEASRGSREQARAFSELGINVTDASGRMRAAEDIFNDVVIALNAIGSDSERAARAQQIFGRAGADLLPLMQKLGKEGLAGVRAEAERLGLVWDTNTARAAEEFNDSLKRMGGLLQGLINREMRVLLPLLQGLTASFTASSGRIATAADNAGTAVGALINALAQLNAVRRTLISKEVILGGIPGLGPLIVSKKLRSELQRAERELQAILEPPSPERPAAGAAAAAGGAFEGLSKGMQRARDAAEQVIARLKEQIATLGMSAEAVELYRLRQAGATEEQIAAVAALQDTLAEMQRLAAFRSALGFSPEGLRLGEFAAAASAAFDRLAESARALEPEILAVSGELERGGMPLERWREEMEQLAQRIFADTRTAAERYHAQLARVNQLHAEGFIDSDTYGRRIRQLEDDFRSAVRGSSELQGAGKQIQNVFVTFFTRGIDDAENFGAAMSSLARDVVNSLRQIAVQMLINLTIGRLLSRLFGFLKIPGLSEGGKVGEAKGLAAGGRVRGPGTGTSDDVPAWLSRGEYVVREAVVRQPGMLEFLEALNRQQHWTLRAVRGFAAGGLVEDSFTAAPQSAAARAVLGGGTVVQISNDFRGANFSGVNPEAVARSIEEAEERAVRRSVATVQQVRFRRA